MVLIMENIMSIIVPMYNAEKTIENTLKKTQEIITPCEIILIDDGSTDGTVAICERLASTDNRIKIIKTDNYGVSHARNIGIEEAKTEFIIFLDADDFYTINDFKLYIDYMKSKKSDIGVFGVIKEIRDKKLYCTPSFEDFARTYDNDEQIRKIRRFVIERDYSTLPELKNSNIDTKTTSKLRLGSSGGKIIKTELLKKNNIRFHEEISVMEDLLFVNDCFKKTSNISFFSKPIYYYRDNIESVTNKTYNKNALSTYKMLASQFNELKYDFDEKYNIYLQTKIIDCYWAAIRLGIISNKNITYKEKKNIMENYLNDDIFEKLLETLSLTPIKYKIKYFLMRHKYLNLIELIN